MLIKDTKLREIQNERTLNMDCVPTPTPLKNVTNCQAMFKL